MSVSLLEVLENAGYDIKNNIDDARWFLSQQDEIEELCDEANLILSSYDEYCDYIATEEESGNYDNLTWEEWRE